MDKVVHFEVPYDELDRIKKFYTEVFGWQIKSILKVEQAGGGVFRPKISIGEMGFYAEIKDTEGNIIGL